MDGPRFTHVDDELPWQEVRRQRHGKRVASIHEKWFEFSPRYLSLYARWDPGMMVHAHGHNSDHVILVIEGEMTCGDVRCTPGTHIAPDQGDSFGPFIAGPEGVVLFEVMMGDPRSFPADPDGWQRLLDERGSNRCPTPRSTCRRSSPTPGPESGSASHALTSGTRCRTGHRTSSPRRPTGRPGCGRCASSARDEPHAWRGREPGRRPADGTVAGLTLRAWPSGGAGWRSNPRHG